MARSQSAFRQADVTKAIRAVKAAGVHIATVELAKDGTIRIITTADTANDSGLRTV
jgi:hypothetical protein